MFGAITQSPSPPHRAVPLAARDAPASSASVASPALPDASVSSVSWGWLPALSLIAALGTLCVAVAYTGARWSNGGTEIFFWIGLLLVFVPAAVRLAVSGISRVERAGCIVLQTFALYTLKLMQSPFGFTLYDELLHWRTANDIAHSHHLFRENPLLPVSPIFSGLENATSAVGSLTGLSLFGAGIVVVGATHLVLALALYLLFEEIGQSAWIAGVGTTLYLANPSFPFFDSQFAYESFALPFALFALFAFVRAARTPPGPRAVWLAASFLAVVVTVVSHHVTSYILLLFLALWTAVRLLARVFRVHRHDEPNPAGLTIFTFLMCLVWLVFAATIVVTYLAAPINNGLREFVRLVTGEQQSRQLFKAEGGQVQPKWEQFVGFGSVFAILGGLPFGLWGIWLRHRGSALALALGAGALVYPATLALRFTSVGAEISSRAVAFLFVALMFVLAVGLAHWWAWLNQLLRRGTLLAFAGFATLLFLGGIVTGYGPSVARLPGPYLVGADARSIEPEGLTAAAWALQYLGPNHRIGADRVNTVLMGTYGEQYTITELANHVDLSPVFFSLTDTDDVQDALKRAQLRYLVIDRRITQGLPLFGFYIQQGEADGAPRTAPVSPLAVEKFDHVAHVSRVFDSGDIVIYDVKAVSGGA